MPANDSRQDTPWHRTATELAELLATPEGARTARLLQQLGTMENAPTSAELAPQPEPEPDVPRPIGIWQPRQLDGELVFERPPVSPLGDHHASRRRLRATKPAGSKRLGWFGESAAAGYLYAPRWTPAQVLEERLCLQADQPWQVVDLARTNERLAPLVERIDAARQLDLDQLVIYAGNNWPLLELPEGSPYHSGVRSRQRWAAAWRRHGPGGPALVAGEQLEGKILASIDQIEHLAEGRPVTWVVPAVDLLDWQTAQPPTWMADDGVERWHRHHLAAKQGLAEGNSTPVRAATEAMLDLDQGHNPTAYRLLAEAHRLDGKLAEARQAARTAIDRQSYANLAMLAAPQANSAVVELLRQAVPAKGWQLVDLPKLFERQGANRAGNGPLFLDYCHLQASGVQLLTRAVADAIVGESSDDDNDSNGSLPDPATEAIACLGAAVHGAHRLLTSANKVAYLTSWLNRALAADPSGEAAMLDLLEARVVLPGEELLSAALQRNLDSQHPLGLQHGCRWQHLDCDLLEAACQTLESRRPEFRAWLSELLIEHHAADHKPRQLAAPPYLWEPLEQLFPEAIGDNSAMRSMLRAAWPVTRLSLVTRGDSPIALNLVARLPPTAGLDPDRHGSAECRLNGRSIGQLALDCRWQRHHLVLATEAQHPGLQQLSIHWPPLPPAGEAALEAALRRLEEGIEADLHPIFGELASAIAGPK